MDLNPLLYLAVAIIALSGVYFVNTGAVLILSTLLIIAFDKFYHHVMAKGISPLIEALVTGITSGVGLLHLTAEGAPRVVFGVFCILLAGYMFRLMVLPDFLKSKNVSVC